MSLPDSAATAAPIADRAAILDVGHGNACVLEAGTAVAVIDTGREDDLMRYLVDRELFDIDHLILSHGDEDHIAAAYTLLSDRRYRVRNVYYSAEQFRSTDIYGRVRRAAKDAEVRHGTYQSSLSRGTRMIVGCAQLDVLHPSHSDVSGARSTARSNTLSIMVRISTESAGGVIFLAGDGDGSSVDDIREFASARKLDPTARYLVFPHHGSAVAAGKDVAGYVKSWLKLVLPKTVLFSTKRSKAGSRWRHPDPRVIQQIVASEGDGVLVMCTQLSVDCQAEPMDAAPHHIQVEGNGIRRLRSGRCPCAGTTVIDLRTGELLEPRRQDHEEFKDALGTPMCRG